MNNEESMMEIDALYKRIEEQMGIHGMEDIISFMKIILDNKRNKILEDLNYSIRSIAIGINPPAKGLDI